MRFIFWEKEDEGEEPPAEGEAPPIGEVLREVKSRQ